MPARRAAPLPVFGIDVLGIGEAPFKHRDQPLHACPPARHVVPEPRDPFDYVYYSAMVYTTVGFGDLVPEGPIRMISSTQALTGLSLITWTASFTYLQMQRVWRD